MERIVISPSGKLYGSEQVLFDYLANSKWRFKVFVPQNSEFAKLLSEQLKQHEILEFGTVRSLYFQLFNLCVFRKIGSVYCNEAGHVKYIALFAKWFKRISFFIHLRILEDTQAERWTFRELANLKVIVISKYLQQAFGRPCQVVYDLYPFSKDCRSGQTGNQSGPPLQIGIIGRISRSKGIENMMALLNEVRVRNLDAQFNFNFFGEFSEDARAIGADLKLKEFTNVTVNGFVANKEGIYNSLNCVLHATEREPLGRIFLESIDYCKPLVGIAAGGIGEIARLLNLESMMVGSEARWNPDAVIDKLIYVRDHYNDVKEEVQTARTKALEIFSIAGYTSRIDELLQ